MTSYSYLVPSMTLKGLERWIYMKCKVLAVINSRETEKLFKNKEDAYKFMSRVLFDHDLQVTKVYTGINGEEYVCNNYNRFFLNVL